MKVKTLLIVIAIVFSVTIAQPEEECVSVLTDARVVPHFTYGKLDGYKIFAIDPAGIYASYGLVDGDIIIRVNSYDVDSPDFISEFCGDHLSVTVRRGDWIVHMQ